jgi:hypothetical protein
LRANDPDNTLAWEDPERPWLAEREVELPIPRVKNPQLYYSVFHVVASMEMAGHGVNLDPKAIGFLIGQPGMKIWGKYSRKQGEQYIRQLLAGSKVHPDRDLDVLRTTLWVSGAYPLPKAFDVNKKGLDECLRVLVQNGWLRRVGRGRYGQDPSRTLRTALHELKSAELVEGCTVTNFRVDRTPEEQHLLAATCRMINACGRILGVLQAHGIEIPNFEFKDGWDLVKLQRLMFQPRFLAATQPSADMAVRAYWYKSPQKYRQFLEATTKALDEAAPKLRAVYNPRAVENMPIWAIMGAKDAAEHDQIQAVIRREWEAEKAQRTPPR